MSIMIHGKEYITVAERIKKLHDSLKEEDVVSIETEVLQHDPRVVIKATLKINDNVFCGISAANPSKSIEKESPYEVAESSAIGRACGFAGFGIVGGIATADEMVKAGVTEKKYEKEPMSVEMFDRSDICNKCQEPGMVRQIKNGKPENIGKHAYFCKDHGFVGWAPEHDTKTVSSPRANDPEMESLMQTVEHIGI